MPAILMPDSDATPAAFVVAPPTEAPFSVKLIVLPLTVELSEVFRSVAESEVVPAYGPLAGVTLSVVAAAAFTA